MSAIAACPVQLPAARVLTAAALRGALSRFRLPSYSAIAGCLRDASERFRYVHLWQDMWHELPPPGLDSCDLSMELVARVNTLLFPVDTGYMDDVFNSGENPLDWGIEPDTYGLPWEAAGLQDCPAATHAVLAALAYCDELYQDGSTTADYECPDPITFQEDAGMFWHAWEHALDTCPPPWAQPSVAAFQQALRALRPPLSALGDVVDVVLKSSGNIFLDWPSAFWRDEYDAYSDWDWCPTCLHELAALYKPVSAECERLDAFYDWFEATVGSDRLVAQVVAAVAQGREPPPW